MYKIIETETEELNSNGEYVKTIEQRKQFLGIKYKTIKKVFINKITQAVLDELEESSKDEKGTFGKKKIGFN